MSKDIEEKLKDAVRKPVVDAKEKYTHVVAKGKSITSRRGALSGGQKVNAKFFAGGAATIESLVTVGLIVKV